MNTIKISKLLFSTLFLWGTMANAQHLTISNSGETTSPGTNWSIIGNVLYIGNSGSASINTSVITNHLQNTGDLTINLPEQSNVARNIYINNTIAYLGSSARTLTFQSGNDIVFANTVGITSATASLNIVLRSATTTGTPDNGSIKMDGINIDTKGGHLWVGGGATTTTWNGLSVGNSSARTYLDDVAGISVVGSTIASGGGNIYMYGLSWNSSDDDGVNYGINVQNSTVSSGTGSINFSGGVYGRYNNGIGMRVIGTSATSITSTTGAITIYGYGTDATTNGNLWRTATMISGSVSIKSGSGNIAVTGQAAFASPVNDKEGLVIGDGSAICSQTGNITLNGTNTLESSGQYSNSIRFAAGNLANSIRIGYDGTNAYSGNISIEGNSIYQRSTNAGAGSIAIQTTGTLTIQPTGASFSYMRAGDAGTLTFDNDWNFGTNLGGFVYGKTTNTSALTYSNALTTSGPITIYAGSISQNAVFSTTSATGHIRLQSTADIAQAAALTSQGGSIVLWSDSDGTSGGRIGITANMSTNGGHVYIGGGSASETLNGMTVPSGYATSSTSTLSGISVAGSTINSSGGNIRMKGLNNSINGTNTGIIVSNNSTISSGAGSLSLYGQRAGDPNTSAGLFLGTEISSSTATGNVTISSTSGDIYLEGTTTGVNNSHSWCHGFAIVENAGDDVSITSTTGNISMFGDASVAANYAGEAVGFVIQAATTTSLTNIATDGGSILINGKSSNTGFNYGSSFRSANATANISIGDNNTGNLTLQFGSLSTNAYANSIALNSSGAYVIEGNSGASFASTIDFSNSYTLGSLGTSFRIGSTTNNQNVWMKPAVTVSGPITAYANEFSIYNNLTSTSASDIGIYAKTHFWTYDVRQTLQTAGGNIYLYADADANGSGQLELDYLTFNPGSGNTIIRGETFNFAIGAAGPYLNGTGSITIEPSDAVFGQGIQTMWFTFDQDNNGMGGLNLGKSGNTAQISFDGTNITAGGPVNIYGNNIVMSAALTANGSDVSLYANTAVTQTSPIIAAGLSLNGTGTFTLTNSSNNFTTVAGGAVGSLLGATQIIDVSGGLTIGTVGSTTGLTGSSTIRVETLAGDLTLAGNISTSSTSTDAVILTAAKSTAIGVPTGGDILVSGNPSITMGTGGIAKLFSGYDVTSTGLTALAGASNVRINYDETTTTFNPVLSANNKYAIYRTALGYGDLNIVSSGGDAEGTTWTYANGVITTTRGTANVLNTVIETKLNSGNLSIEANKVTFSTNVTGTTNNALSILSKTHIVNTNATTITTQGGNVLFASNVDDATDGESTTNGYIQLRQGITVNSNGGDITFGGGNILGSDYSLGSSDIAYTEGIRFDAVIALNSGGGNIALRGKSYAMGVYTDWGASGVGFYFFSAATGTINSGTGTITIDGYSQTNTSIYAAGFYCMHNLTITSANTTSNAINITGKATGASGEAWGIESESTLSVLATGTGGGITINTSKQLTDNFDAVFRGETNILAVSGPINLKTGQLSGTSNGYLYLNGHMYLGSKAGSAVTSSSSNINIQVDRYYYENSALPKLATSGSVTIQPNATSFGTNLYTSYFNFNQNGQTMTDFTFGKPGNAGNLYLNTAFTVAGPINAYGGYVEVSNTITSSATGNILLKGIVNSGSCVNISGGITKSSGTGTLTMQGHGRVNNTGTITTSGTGVLNVIMWSDYDGDNVGGGSTLVAGGSISTNGGHIWMGGSNSNGGSYSWNGLAVGDGPSTGAASANCNAIDLFGPITTAGGDVLLWASNNGGCGLSGIQSDGTRLINASSGDITLIAYQTGGAIELTSTGIISLLPHAGSYTSALTLGGTLTSGNFSFNTSHYNGLKINNMSTVGGLTIGRTEELLSSGNPVVFGNTSNVTISSALSIAGPISVYGGNIFTQQNLTSTQSGAAILLQATGYIDLTANRTIQTSNGNITLRANAGGTAVVLPNSTTGAITLNSGSSLLSTGGNITLGGNFDGTKGAGLYAASARVNGAPGILISGATLTAAGGNINIYGRCSTSYDDGIRLQANITTTGAGSIGLYGDAFGGLVSGSPDVWFGGITFITNSSTIETENGNINVEGILTNTQSNGTYALNFYRSVYTSGTNTRDIQIISRTGDIQITGDRGTTSAGGMGSSSWGDIYFGSPLSDSWTASGDVKFSYSSFVGAGVKGYKVKTTGAVTYEPTDLSFANAQTFPHNSNYTVAESASSLTIGKAGNSANITMNSAQTVAGPISIYAGTITLNAGLTATNSGDISFYSDNAIAGLTASRTVTAAGSFNYLPQSNSFIATVTYPITNLNVSSAGLLIGKPTNSANITFANTTTINGPITAYGGTITLNANLTATSNGNISLYTDNALGGLSTARTLSAAGAFKYIPRGTSFAAAVTYPITNLSATCTGLTIGNVTNDKDITINANVEGGAGIELYGNNLAINSNLKTTSSADMYLKGNTTIASEKYIESNGNFTHDGNLIFKSDAMGTAAFGALGGTFTTVSGLATTERYIPAKRAWRLLNAPLKGATNTTVTENWQGVNGEGLLLFSPATYQSQTMTGYTLGGGMPNIWKYNNGWQAIPNLTNENLFTTTGTNGFLVFATGTSDSNTIVLGETATTLKPQGQLITGAVVNSIIGNQYNLVPNPYASALNTETMVQANAGSKVWMVDPSLGNFGGYTTYDGTNWAPTTPTVSDKNIQSGQAFFVRTASNSTFSITESHKISGSSNTWFSRTANSPADKIRVLLYKQDNAEWKLADGILAVNSASGNNEVDNTDTGKMSNFNENLLFRNGTSNLAIEYRGLPTAGTTQPMRLTGTTVQPYQLKVKAESYTNTNLQPYIQDTQLGTVTAIPTDGSEIVLPFTGVAASSTNPDSRFIIIYLSTLSTNNPDVLSVGVYPNPVNTGVFTVSLKENTTPANYSLTNLLGQQVQVGKLMSLNNSVNVTSLQIGIYILQVEQEGKTFSTKLIIK